MLVREWMNADPVTIEPSADVVEARSLMSSNRIRHLPVVDDGRVVGILSDRDVQIPGAVLYEVAERLAKSGDARAAARVAEANLLVETVMSRPVRVISPDETVETAARLLLSERINGLPVLEDGKTVD